MRRWYGRGRGGGGGRDFIGHFVAVGWVGGWFFIWGGSAFWGLFSQPGLLAGWFGCCASLGDHQWVGNRGGQIVLMKGGSSWGTGSGQWMQHGGAYWCVLIIGWFSGWEARSVRDGHGG